MTFAVADALSILSSGNLALILAFIIIVLGGVIIYLFKLYLKILEKNSILQDKRLDDAILNRDKYDTVMGKFSQSFDLFVAKIENKDK